MERRLENLKESMDNTVLKSGRLTESDKHRIFQTAITVEKTKKRYFLAPVLSFVMCTSILLIMGGYIYTQITQPEMGNLNAAISSKFELYEGKSLSIAVIGEPPQVREAQINFKEITFDDLTKEDLVDFDAVIIMGENLNHAAESQYADIYINSPIPFFFISTTSHLPFTQKDIEYGETWNWTPGNSYAVGVLKSQEDDELRAWGYGLYDDEKTNEHIEDVYSRIFMTIEELKS
ncbi:hypothetical protein [Neobacillus sp.]|uniref:hypothetical protein n=1 Tax=Neobacillus sp. TaxID=2675273 RepID=UPI0028A1FB84|nr:hypothetical protein [Neobacillus sp.]